jgi:hypothetical protein
MSTFKEFYHKDVSQFVEKVQGANYLSWARAWALVKEVDEKATYKIHEFPMLDADFRPIAEGVTVPYLKTPEGYLVKVTVTINGQAESMMLPVMDNKNVPLGTIAPTWKKGEGKAKAERVYDNTPMPTSFDLNKSHMRCLVKAIAMHGLGLYLYEKEEAPREDQEKIRLQTQEAAEDIRDYQKSVRRTESKLVADRVDAKVDEFQTRAKRKIEEMDLDTISKIKLLLVKAKDEAIKEETEQKELEAAVQE